MSRKVETYIYIASLYRRICACGGDDEEKRQITLWSTIKGSAFPIHVSAIVLAWPLQHGKNEDTLQGGFQSIKTSPRTRSGKILSSLHPPQSLQTLAIPASLVVFIPCEFEPIRRNVPTERFQFRSVCFSYILSSCWIQVYTEPKAERSGAEEQRTKCKLVRHSPRFQHRTCVALTIKCRASSSLRAARLYLPQRYSSVGSVSTVTSTDVDGYTSDCPTPSDLVSVIPQHDERAALRIPAN